MHFTMENMAKSVTKETKAKFDSLLKLALNKKESKSVQNLIETDINIKDATSGHINEAIEMKEELVSKNFILDKFLNDEEVKENDSGSFTVPPIPKPRTKFQKSNGSNETFSIKSANILNVVNRNTDSDSNETYDLPKRITREDFDTSSSSAKTYDINKTAVIGDILYEDRICKASVVELNRQSPAQRSVKSQRLSGHEIEMANFGEEAEQIQTVEDIVQETDTRSVISETSTKITFENELKGKKKKKKKEKTVETMEETAYKYENILGIIVHNSDRLELDFFVIHPVVKVYLVDYETGKYIEKTDSGRGAVFHVESTDLTYIMPVITQNYNLQENRRFKPEWEETIIINEDFNYITNPATRTILFFELLDFVGFSEAAVQSSVYSRGWHRIAWAFLRINAANASTNTGKKLRLQLYKPGKDIKNSCPVFDWWRGKRIKYPSTLYVTVKAITSPNTVAETFRSKTPLEREKSVSLPDHNVDGDSEEKVAKMIKGDKEKVKGVLSALDSKIWRLPNNTLSDIDSGDEGCFALKFSNSGRFLACAVLVKKSYCLMLYTVPEFEIYYKLPAHQELVYNISFAKDDSYVASSSSDGTVCVWNLEKWSFQQILPHPSFVYWCEFSKDHVIATGCYDKIVRVWASQADKAKKEYFLIEELEGHTGYVTSLCFNFAGNILFSSDAQGEIFLWKRADRTWKHLKTIKLPDLKDTIINQILLHKKERKVVVHARDSIIRIVDVKSECIVHWLEGALNNKVRTLCCITTCFSYIASGSDNGIVHIWNANTGKSVATYHPYDNIVANSIPIHAVDVSPVGNLMAVSHFGRPLPIFVHNFDHTKCKDKLYFTDETPSQSLVHKSKKDEDSSEEKGDSEKDVDWKNILEKIDRIIS